MNEYLETKQNCSSDHFFLEYGVLTKIGVLNCLFVLSSHGHMTLKLV